MDKRNFCVLVNPHANRGHVAAILPAIIKTLQNLKVSFRYIVSQDIAHAKAEAIKAIQQGETVVAMGGDGTLREMAGVISQYNGVLAIIPAGRGNDLARMLQIPLDPIQACKVLISGKEKIIDIGDINGEPFLTICTMGFDSVANEYANQTKYIPSQLVYVYGGLRTLISWKPMTFHIKIDGRPLTHVGYNVSIANSYSYAAGLKLAPNASLHDGLFDVVLVGLVSKFRILVNITKLLLGKPVNEPGFTIVRAKHVTITRDNTFGIHADGDFICRPPAEIRIQPGALRVMASPLI